MKTVKFLKIDWICQIIFFVICALSALVYAIHYYFDIRFFFYLGEVLRNFWLPNPIAFYNLIGGMVFFLIERKHDTHRKVIGRKWIWFIALFLIDSVLWMSSGLAWVFFTGGI